MSLAHVECDGQTWHVLGDLDFPSVATLWESTRTLFEKAPPTQVDLGQSRANSAGVALLVEWHLWSQQRGQTLSFINVPAHIGAMMRMTGVDTLLGCGSTQNGQ